MQGIARDTRQCHGPVDAEQVGRTDNENHIIAWAVTSHDHDSLGSLLDTEDTFSLTLALVWQGLEPPRWPCLQKSCKKIETSWKELYSCSADLTQGTCNQYRNSSLSPLAMI